MIRIVALRYAFPKCVLYRVNHPEAAVINFYNNTPVQVVLDYMTISGIPIAEWGPIMATISNPQRAAEFGIEFHEENR